MTAFNSIKNEKHKELLQAHFSGEYPTHILKTEFRWKWGWPFPYIAFFENRLVVIAVKQGKPKEYFSFRYSDINFIKSDDETITISTNEDTKTIPIILQSRDLIVPSVDFANSNM